MIVPFVRSAFTHYDPDQVTRETGLDCSCDPSMAQQSMRDECDINVMVERFAHIGAMPPPLPSTSPVDFDEVFDFQTAMNAVIDGQAAFMRLPAKVRDRFQNDPGQFLDFIATPDNYDEAVSLGLVEPRKSEPVPVPPTPAPDSP